MVKNRTVRVNRNNYDEEDLRCECEQIYLKPHRKSYQLKPL